MLERALAGVAGLAAEAEERGPSRPRELAALARLAAVVLAPWAALAGLGHSRVVAVSRRVDWVALVAGTVHPTKVLVLEAAEWIGEPVSARDLDRVFLGAVRLGDVAYHVRGLAALGALEKAGQRQVRGALENVLGGRGPGVGSRRADRTHPHQAGGGRCRRNRIPTPWHRPPASSTSTNISSAVTEAAAETREVWECASCSVSSRRPEIGRIPMPSGWEDSGDGPTCLACVRKAGRAAPAGESRESKLERARAASRDALAERRKALDARIRAALLALDDPGGARPVDEIAAGVGCGKTRVRECAPRWAGPARSPSTTRARRPRRGNAKSSTRSAGSARRG